MASQKITYLAGGPDGKIVVKSSVRGIGGVEVLIKVTHSGVCGTDVHNRTHGCGLGHEGVGIVEKIGSEVTSVKIGQRVGWGWQLSSCGSCKECVSGYRQYCTQACGQGFGETEQGAFGDFMVKHQDFIYSIPESIESKYAGPLNCAGITVYEALCVAGTKSSDKVGIVGLGGLGHIAVMYAKAMGCEVVVFSGNEDKKDDALALGATEFSVLPKKGESVEGTSGGINVLLICGGSLPDFEVVLPLLGRRAAIIPLVIQGEPMVIPYMPFLLPGHRIIGSTEASREHHVDALSFAARHNIKPWIEEYSMSRDGLTEAMDALARGKVRYRAVLSTEVLGGGKFE